jgi:uncharacterized protein (TIGR03437 family)
MRLVTLLLLGCTAASPQLILPPALDASGRTVFFGSSISPDGLQSTVDLYAVDSSGQRRLTQLAAGNYISYVVKFAMNRDGSQFAYAATTASGPAVRTVDLNSGTSITLPAPTALFVPASIHIVEPGNQILVTAQTQRQFPVVAYLFNADGSGTSLKILDGSLAPSAQRVTSNNGFLVFTGDPNHSPDPNPHLAHLDGSGVRALTDFSVPPPNVYPRKIASDATISISGDIVAFTTTEGAASQVWTVLTDGSGFRALTAPDEGCHSPSLSGDGSLAAFICNGQVNVARTDASAERQALTDFHWSAATNPVLSEDGSRVAFTIEPAGWYGPMNPGAVWAVKTDGTELRSIHAPHVISSVKDAFNGSDATPGGFASMYGYNLANESLTVAGTSTLPESLNGVSLLVNGRAVPILAVAPWQLNAQLPFDIPIDTPASDATFQFRFADGSTSNMIHSRLTRSSVHILGLPRNGCTNVFHAGTGMPADAAHPVQAGETVEIYAVGLGPTDPVVPAGVPAPSSPPAKLIDLIGIDVQEPLMNVSVPVVFAGLAPGMIGIYQINATIPKGLVGPNIKNFYLRIGGGSAAGCFF